jgi:hypothetical protein
MRVTAKPDRCAIGRRAMRAGEAAFPVSFETFRDFGFAVAI